MSRQAGHTMQVSFMGSNRKWQSFSMKTDLQMYVLTKDSLFTTYWYVISVDREVAHHPGTPHSVIRLWSIS